MKTRFSHFIVVVATVSVTLLSACAAWRPADATLAPGKQHAVRGTVEVGKQVTQVLEREGVTRQRTPLPQATATVLVVPVYGGEALPNDEPFDSMFFEHYGVNPFVDTEDGGIQVYPLRVTTTGLPGGSGGS